MAPNARRVFAGRFQPFHNGHLWVVEELLRRYGTVVVGIVNPDPANPPDPKYPSFHPLHNPFSYWERLQMIRGALKGAGLTGAMIVPLQHPRAELKADLAVLPAARTWVVPPLDQHEKDKILDLKRLGETVEELHVPDALRFLSSSMIRGCMLRNKGGCRAIAGTGGECCPSAVSSILRRESAVYRMERLTSQTETAQLSVQTCPRFAPTDDTGEMTLEALKSNALAVLDECRRYADELHEDVSERMRTKNTRITPLAESVKAANDGEAVASAHGAALALREQLKMLARKKGG